MRQVNLISTTMGNTLMDSNSQVYVHIVGDEYARKPASEVRSGEMVLFKKEYVRTTLDDVVPVLERSPRYAIARNNLFEQNSHGIYVPVLRTELWRGLFDMEGVQRTAELEDRIVLNIDDFTDEYSPKKAAIHRAVMTNSNLQISDSSVYHWLKGDIIAPRNWDIFRVFEQINPVFSNFDSSNRSMGGRFYQYKLYVTLHQGIMRYLAECKGEGIGPQGNNDGNGEGEDSPANGGTFQINMAPEIRLVMDEFMKDINEQHALARVTANRIVGKKGLSKDEDGPKLSKGVCSGRPSGVAIREKTIYEILNEKNVLNELFIHMTVNYIRNTVDPMTRSVAYLDEAKLTSQGVLTRYPDCPSFVKDSWNRQKSKSSYPNLKNHLDNLICQTFYGIQSGKYDSNLNLQEGTTANLINLFMALSNIIPDSAIKNNARLIELAHLDSLDSKLEKERLQITKRMERQGLCRITGLNVMPTNTKVFRNSLPENVGMGEEYLFTKEEVASILAKYGLEQLLRFIPPDQYMQ